jgi:uncharacterized protein (DUF58 family)
MRVTPRFWEVVGLGGVLSALAVVLGRPALLVGAGVLGGFLLVRQYAFVSRVIAAADVLSVTQSASRAHVIVDEPFAVTLHASSERPLPLDVAVRANPPVSSTGVDADEATVRLSGEETAGTTAFRTALATVGVGSFDAPTVTFRSRDGLFEATAPMGEPTSVTGEPRAPGAIHVGRGGERIATGLGEHSSEQRGPGLEPAEIRRYVHGDDTGRIDWKATARLNRPHVRESTVSTAHTTALVVDHRRSTAEGTPGRRKLDYLREVAVAFLDSADAFGDPVGLFAVGDEGATAAVAPRSSRGHYRMLRTALYDLRPTESGSPAVDPSADRSASSRHLASAMVADETAFSRTLEPYFRATERYVARFEDRPLFSTVARRLGRVQGTTYALVFSDDANRSELYETVKAASRGDRRVVAFLAPSVLFRSDPAADFESAYHEYRDFERFRARLARLDGVTAFEVGPEDRLRAIVGRRSNAVETRRGSP